MANFLRKHVFRTSKPASTQTTEVPKRRSRILKEIKRTGKTVREIFRKENNKGTPQPSGEEAASQQEIEQPAEGSLQQQSSNNPNAASHQNAELSAEASSQPAQCDDSNDTSPTDGEQTTTEGIEPVSYNGADEGTQQDVERPVDGSSQQTPKAAGNDSGYNSPQDETSAWEKILEMRERDHQNDLAAMQDEHDDEVKDLRKELSSEVGKKQLLQKRVKKEVLAKKDFKLQLDKLQEEHRAVVEASKNKDAEIEEMKKEALALRGRLQEMEMGFQVKESSYLDTLKIQGELVKAKEDEIVDLRLDTLGSNSEVPKNRVDTDARKPQVGDSATNGSEWEAWYHHASGNGQRLRHELEICSRQRDEAMAFATEIHTQLELAKTANDKLSAEVASKQQQIEVDGRYHEQIRGQNFDLQNRLNESIADVAQLKYKKIKAEQEAAEDVKDLTRKLDNRTAELSALEATRAEWQADPEGVLLTPSADIDTKALILALAKRFQLTLNENDNLKQRMAVREQEYGALNKKLRHMKAQRDGLSESLAQKAEEVTSLKGKIHELDTVVLSREMDKETEKRAEPLYLQAMEDVAQKDDYISQCLDEIRRLRDAVSENEEGVDSGALAAQHDQARKAALHNRQQHIAKVEKLKDLIEKLYQRMLQLEATLAAAGRTIEEPDDEGDMLKAQCARVLGYDGAESESETASPTNQASGRENGNSADAALEQFEARNLPESGPNLGNVSGEGASRANNVASDTNLDDLPANQAEHELNDEAATERSSESSTTITVRRFVMRALAEGGTRTRVLGEPSSPAAPATPEISTLAVPPTQAINPSREGGIRGIPSDDTDNGSEEDGNRDLQPYHPPPVPAASLAWMKKYKPFGYGEPVGDDQFGKETLQTRR